MVKKKKGRNDARGYGQSTQQKAQTKTLSKPKLSSSPTSAETAGVTSKTHEELSDLLEQLRLRLSAVTTGKRPKKPSATSVEPNRFSSRLSTIVARLEELKFSYDPHIRLAVQALGYDISLDNALDWLCLNLETAELPSLFTEAKLRDATQQVSDSVTVLNRDDDMPILLSSIETQSPTEEPEKLAKICAGANTELNPYLQLSGSAISKTGEMNCVDNEAYSAANAPQDDEQKAWLLSQYGYEEDDEDGLLQEADEAVILPPIDNPREGLKELLSEESALTEGAHEEQAPQLPEMEFLKSLRKELAEAQADLNNDANNYMRSKQEIKKLRDHVKLLKNQVQKVEKKVEKINAAAQSKMGLAEEEEDGGGDMMLLFGKAVDNDDDEVVGGGVINIFRQDSVQPAQKEKSNEITESKAVNDARKDEHVETVDYSIPKTWTGTTPQKVLIDWCRKHKLYRPRYQKLPRNSGISLTVQRKGKKSEPLKLEHTSSGQNFKGDPQEYLAIQALYEMEPGLPMYTLFPPTFRSLWLSWVNVIKEVEERGKQEARDKKQQKIEELLTLIAKEFSLSDQTPAERANPSEKKESALQDDDKNAALPLGPRDEEDSWSGNDVGDFDIGPVENHPSTHGLKLQSMFRRRQSSSDYLNMEKFRKGLPMYAFRESVLNTIRDNPVTVLCAETGAGKTTQCPQYLLENALLQGQGDKFSALITQPRRIAAISVAERVAEELCEPLGKMIGYQIRMEAKRSSSTRLMFCTTGIVLRRLQEDSKLEGISHVIVDEVHERQQQTDVLLIALRQLLQTTRPDLKVILMSATLDSELFCTFFHQAPLLSVPGRTFPVANYYLEDLIDATDHVIEEGSRYANRDYRSSDQASLWFSTRGGERRKETVDLVSQVEVNDVSDQYQGYKVSTRRSMDRVNEEVINYDLIEDVLNLVLIRAMDNQTLLPPDGAVLSTGSILIFLPGLGEIRSLSERLEGSRTLGNKERFDIIPMHSTLSPSDQRRAFIPTKPGCQKLILSTNIAETSVTIDDVVAVIDCGRVREVRQNKRTSTPVLVTDWCSKASAKQRAGRAGRVQPGICFKLYSSRVAQCIMKDSNEPELRRVPLEEICLSILASGFSNSCTKFLEQAPQPPAEESVQIALQVLQDIGAISIKGSSGSKNKTEKLTPLGHHLSRLPVDVRLGKMLIFGSIFHCIDKVLIVAASLSSQNPFSTFIDDAGVAQLKHKAFADPESDFVTICNVWEGFLQASLASESTGKKFCMLNYLSYTALREIRDARWHFLDLLANIGFINKDCIAKGSKGEIIRDRNLIAENLTRSVYNEHSNKPEVLHAVICAGLGLGNVARVSNPVGLITIAKEAELWHKQQRIFFHSTSVNYKYKLPLGSKRQERWVVFYEKFGTPNRVSVSTTCFVHPFALLLFGNIIDVHHLDRKVVIDEWIEIAMAAQSAVMLRELRQRVNWLLQDRIKAVAADRTSPHESESDSIDSIMLNGIVKLLNS